MRPGSPAAGLQSRVRSQRPSSQLSGWEGLSVQSTHRPPDLRVMGHRGGGSRGSKNMGKEVPAHRQGPDTPVPTPQGPNIPESGVGAWLEFLTFPGAQSSWLILTLACANINLAQVRPTQTPPWGGKSSQARPSPWRPRLLSQFSTCQVGQEGSGQDFCSSASSHAPWAAGNTGRAAGHPRRLWPV